MPEGISDAVARGWADSAANAVVLIGAGTTFIAGADINIFKTLRTRAIPRALRGVSCATEHGGCGEAARGGHPWARPGGGLEFAVACHYRVAVASAQVGQPGDARHHSWRGWHAEVAAAQSPRHGARTVRKESSSRRHAHSRKASSTRSCPATCSTTRWHLRWRVRRRARFEKHAT